MYHQTSSYYNKIVILHLRHPVLEEIFLLFRDFDKKILPEMFNVNKEGILTAQQSMNNSRHICTLLFRATADGILNWDNWNICDILVCAIHWDPSQRKPTLISVILPVKWKTLVRCYIFLWVNESRLVTDGRISCGINNLRRIVEFSSMNASWDSSGYTLYTCTKIWLYVPPKYLA